MPSSPSRRSSARSRSTSPSVPTKAARQSSDAISPRLAAELRLHATDALVGLRRAQLLGLLVLLQRVLVAQHLVVRVAELEAVVLVRGRGRHGLLREDDGLLIRAR